MKLQIDFVDFSIYFLKTQSEISHFAMFESRYSRKDFVPGDARDSKQTLFSVLNVCLW